MLYHTGEHKGSPSGGVAEIARPYWLDDAFSKSKATLRLHFLGRARTCKIVLQPVDILEIRENFPTEIFASRL